MPKSLWAISLGSVLVAACNSAPPAPPFKPIADVKELMRSVIDPNANAIWDASGQSITSAGVVQHQPKDQDAWDAVRNSAVTLTEAGNLLMMVPRARDRDEWMKRSQEMIDTGLAAWKAAEAKNVDKLLDSGGDLYEACSNCHRKYLEKPVNANK